jgi:FkbM family methyltransferase
VAKSSVLFDELSGLLRDAPIVLVDVGARGGIPDRWRRLEPWLRTVGFEPDARSFEALAQSDRTTIFPTALTSQPGNLTLHVTAEEGDSSVLAPNLRFLDRFPRAERFDVVETRTVEGDTLDNQLAEGGVDHVDFIKLDTQGSELMVLEGARDTLGRGVFGIDVEVELNPMYNGQPLLPDVDDFLRPLGYELFDLEPRRWKYTAGRELALTRGQIVWADAVYLLGPEHVLPLLCRDGDVSAEMLAHVVVICLLYDLGDYALALLDALGDTVGAPLRDPLKRIVLIDDATRKAGLLGLTTRVSSSDMRRLAALCAATGTSPAKQLRAALRAWLDAQDPPA